MGVHRQSVAASTANVQETAGWSPMEIFMVSLFAVVVSGTLLASVVRNMNSPRRANEMAAELAAELDSTMAELAVRHVQVSGPQSNPGRGEGSIAPNIRDVPEDQLAKPPCIWAKDRGSRLGADSDGEGGESEDESMWEVPARAGGSLWFPTPLPAARVRPNEIKLVTVPRRRLQNQARDGDATVTPTLTAPWGCGGAAGDRMQYDPRREGSVRDRNPWKKSQGRLTASSRSLVPLVPLVGQRPRLAKDDRQTEAYTIKAEVSTLAKVVSSMRMAPSSTRSGAMDGPDAPESSLSSVPSSPVVPHADLPGSEPTQLRHLRGGDAEVMW